MIIYKKISDITARLESLRHHGTLGFVPTMGALHEGHLQLLRAAKEENQINVVSIFVNPAQFNDPKDFQKYPVTIEPDIEKLLRVECDILFLPDREEMYPGGIQPVPAYDLGMLDKILEGKFRPGHFQGVCRAVDKLLSIVAPDTLYMGQKDYQQCMVIGRLLEITNRRTRLKICNTVRESDGLAMSSRNLRLTPEQRSVAPKISETLQYFADNLKVGNLEALYDYGHKELTVKGFRVDYIAFAHAHTLELTDTWNGTDPLVALVAAFLGDIRLIDNRVLAM